MECQKPGSVIESKAKLAVISYQLSVGSWQLAVKSKSIACAANHVVFKFFVFN